MDFPCGQLLLSAGIISWNNQLEDCIFIEVQRVLFLEYKKQCKPKQLHVLAIGSTNALAVST